MIFQPCHLACVPRCFQFTKSCHLMHQFLLLTDPQWSEKIIEVHFLNSKSERPNTGFNPKPKVQKMIFFYLSQNHLLLHQEMETSVNALSFFHHQLKLNIILFGYLMPPPLSTKNLGFCLNFGYHSKSEQSKFIRPRLLMF